jgi:hypothetical protein
MLGEKNAVICAHKKGEGTYGNLDCIIEQIGLATDTSTTSPKKGYLISRIYCMLPFTWKERDIYHARGTHWCPVHMANCAYVIWNRFTVVGYIHILVTPSKRTLDYCAERIWYTTCSSDGINVMVFNATFNNNSAISGRSVLFVENTTDLPQITDKLDHIMMYRVHLDWAGFELTVRSRWVFHVLWIPRSLHVILKSTNPPKSTKRTINSHLNSLNIETMTYDIGNLGSGLGQEQKCGGIEPVNMTSSFILIVVSIIWVILGGN